jgi:hypothetical protein
MNRIAIALTDHMKRLMTAATCLYVVLSPVAVLAWDAGPSACKHNECSGNEWRGNTHLWIVNRALDLLKKSDDPIARRVVERMNKTGAGACREQWESGLWDTDDGYLAENFGWRQRRGTHFYNPTGKDAFGAPTGITTYSLIAGPAAKNEIQFGDARLNARYRLAGMLRRPGDNLPEINGTINGKPIAIQDGGTGLTNSELWEMKFEALYPGSFYDDTQFGDQRCYDLGIALHYLTDITEPFHASGFDVFKFPTMLHAVYEDYVPRIQARFPVGASVWDKLYITKENGLTPSADQVFDSVAWKSNSLAPDLMKKINATGQPGPPPITPEAGTTCTCPPFIGNKGVDDETGIVLAAAYQSVASYLWAAFNDEYQHSQQGRNCPAGSQLASNDECYQECKVGYTTYGRRCREECPKEGCKDGAQPRIYIRPSTKAKTNI